jgi:DNA-binding transcriptional regulator YhcF (GntR family)
MTDYTTSKNKPWIEEKIYTEQLEGAIQDMKEEGYTEEQISMILHTPEDVYEQIDDQLIWAL